MRILASLLGLSLMTMSVSSCVGSDRARLSAASETIGKNKASTNTVGAKLPALPAKWRANIPHAEVKAGMDPVEGWRRERGSTARANARANEIINFYDGLRSKF